MFTARLIIVGFLLALSAAAPAETVTPSCTTTATLAGQTLPATCYTTWDDWAHTTATVKTHECYTRTSVIPDTTCPSLSCAAPPTDIVCPLSIRVSSVTVPCSTDCCPTTTTTYAPTGPCPTCDPCRVPTVWYTYTTGCLNTPTITEINTIRPTG
ncbi:hypothetical protein SAMD00023353_1800220 [Rosellinia necatrix]|uniref:Uncharacterized protein n=1 Tax=Rosellinia necatrix TaxID=77044 RepID=A0A1W2TEE5_ROSNE|nr:hypothetical protein SAMD00023353_1800220 [Rosellinia necatrix]